MEENKVIDEIVETTYKELYLKALDKIDELKAINKELTYANGSELAQMYKEFFWEYQKALDKACDMLNVYDLAYLPKEKQKTDGQWKEWCLKND